MDEKPYKYPAIVMAHEEGEYRVSLLRDDATNKNSYVEVKIKPGDPMYERVHSAVSVLNMAGAGEEVPDVGAQYNERQYHIELNEAERDAFLK